MRRLSGVAAGAVGMVPPDVHQPLPGSAGAAAAHWTSTCNGSPRAGHAAVYQHTGTYGSPLAAHSSSDVAAAAAAAPPVNTGHACCSCPCSPSAAAAAACDLGAELAALRVARGEYATAVLEQDRVRNALLSSLGERMCTVRRPAFCLWVEHVANGAMGRTLALYGSPAHRTDVTPLTHSRQS